MQREMDALLSGVQGLPGWQLASGAILLLITFAVRDSTVLLCTVVPSLCHVEAPFSLCLALLDVSVHCVFTDACTWQSAATCPHG